MSNHNQESAVRAIDEMLKHLKKPKVIETKDVMKFYQVIETEYDEKIEELQQLIYSDIEDEEKFERLKKVSELLEINIF